MKTIFYIFLLLLFTTAAQAQRFAWAKQFAGPNDSHGNDIVVDAAGNVYTTGYLNGTVDLDPGPGVYNLSQASGAGAYISKLDPNGNFVWAKQFESWNIVSYAIALDAAGNIYTTGFFQRIADFDPGPGVYNLTNVLGADVFICKLTNNGDIIWAKQFGGINNIYLGAYDIAIDGSGNVITTGYFQGIADFDPGPGIFNLAPAGLDDAFVAKLDVNGNFIWARKISGSLFENGQGIAIDAANNIYHTGYFQGVVDFDPGAGVFNMTAANTSDIYISKLDAGGNFVWAKQLSGSSQAFPESIKLNAAGDIFLTGLFRNNIDADPGPGVFNMVSVAGTIDLFLVKLDATGNFSWAKQIGSTGTDRGHDLFINTTGDIYLTGDFESAVDFDPGPAVSNLVSFGSPDAFISKFTTTGNLVWAKQFGGPGMDISSAVVADALENVYATGFFNQTADFDPDPPVFNLASAGAEDAFVLKLSRCSNSTTADLNVSSCLSYTLNNQTYTTNGTYTQTLLNAAGCDSIITLHLTIGGSTTNLSATACDRYVWEGQTYTSSGSYSVTYIGSGGCDSIRNLNLTIKNSVSNTVTASICQGQTFAGYSASGIYIDNFIAANGCDSIRTLNLIVKPKSFNTVNAVICEGQSFAGYSSSGTYINTYTGANGCDSIRTLQLLVNPRKFSSASATICEGQSYFTAGANQTISGIYRDTLSTSLGCDSIITTTLVVNPKPQPQLGPDRNICAGSSFTFNPGAFNSYLWQDMSTLPSFVSNSTGLYWVTVTNSNNCRATDSVRIVAINPLPANFLQETDSICSYGKLLLQAASSYRTYQWSTGVIQNSITVQSPGQYWLRVGDSNGCYGIDTITVLPKNCITGLFVPTAFTPNNDGKNDLFKAIVFGNTISFRLEVYDRAGQLLFRTTDPLKGWNGQNGSVSFSTAVFVWQCFYHLEGEKPGYQKGTVTLIH